MRQLSRIGSVGKKVYEWFRKPRTQRAFQAGWVSLAFVFLIVHILRNWHSFKAQSWRISWMDLSLAVSLALLRKLISGVQWGLVSRYSRENRSFAAFAEDLRVYFISNLATYIPGSVWLVASRIQLNRQRGISVLSTSASMVFEAGLFVWSSCLVGLYVAAQVFPNRVREVSIAASLLVVFSLLLIHPSVIHMLMGHLKKLMKKDQLFFKATYLDGLILFVVAILVWAAGGASHFFLARTFYNDLPPNAAVGITSALALAWTIGYLTPIAPSGLGVRDGILVVLFATWMPNPIAVVVALVSRLLLALEDVIWAVVALLVLSGERVKRERL